MMKGVNQTKNIYFAYIDFHKLCKTSIEHAYNFVKMAKICEFADNCRDVEELELELELECFISC